MHVCMYDNCNKTIVLMGRKANTFAISFPIICSNSAIPSWDKNYFESNFLLIALSEMEQISFLVITASDLQ